MTPTDTAISTRGLTKRFRGRVAVADLDLDVPRGSVFGFLGANGSGKTTTIRMLLGAALPSAGTAYVLGRQMPYAARAVLPRVGAMIEGPAHYPDLTGVANLVRLDAADPTSRARTRRQRVSAALERVGLIEAADRRTGTYSLGMRQRLGLAAALLRPRELLVLDEPTNGLDPQGIREVRTLVGELAAEGTTVFVSSHLLDEIDQMCSHVAILRRGRLVVSETVAQLRAGLGERVVVRTPDPELAVSVLTARGVRGAHVEGDLARGELTAGSAADGTLLEELAAALVAGGVRVRSFSTERPALEEAFVQLTGSDTDGSR
jgi:ABC-2 type transport system ATP-binding protein